MSNYQSPRGTQDVYGVNMSKWHAIEDLIRQFTHVYNVSEIRTPIFEHTEVFKREADSSDMVNKEMYTFTDFGGRSLTLRPEGTAGLIRSFVQNKLYTSPDLPVKFYYVGPNFRYERPQKGRMRIHHQFGVEYLGAKSPLVDAEVIQLGVSFLQAMGLKDLKVLINTLGDDESRSAYRQALKDHFASHLETMCPDCHRRFEQNPLRILDCKVDAQHDAMASAPAMSQYLNEESRAYFKEVLDILTSLDLTVEISDRLVRGLDYYTHTVFEVVSSNEDMGSQSTIFGGGRYDGLIPYFGGPEMSGIGFGMGIERLMVAAEAEGIDLAQENPLDVYVMPLAKEYQHTAASLLAYIRSNGYRSDMDVQGRSLKAMFKTADRQKVSVLLFVGEEVNEGKVRVKHIPSNTQLDVSFDELIMQLDHWLNEDHDHSNCACQVSEEAK